jgi:replication-associated recombination protein RarA
MAKKKAAKYLWPEKFRPESIDEAILPTKFKRFFKKQVKGGQIPNLLLYSSTPGSGKTSIAKALCNEIDADSIYINISSESGIDTLRSTIKDFASTKSFNKRPKVVIMDEADGATPQLQAGLRAFIEEFHSHCRFILTCNYISKIIPPLREGRVMEFDFNMTDTKTANEMKPKQVKRLEQILQFEKVEYKVEALERLVDESYPNMRKMISAVQKASDMYGIVDDSIFTTMGVDSKLYDLILAKKYTAAREHIIQSSYNIDELYPAFFRELVPRIPNKGVQAQSILILAQYQHMHAVAIDPELNISACMLEIIGLL